MTGPEARRDSATAETVTAATVLVVGAVYGYQAVQEGFGTLSRTGSGFFPFMVAVVLAVASAVVLLQERRGDVSPQPADPAPTTQEGADPDEVETRVSWGRVIGVLVASLAVPLLADTIGFVVALSSAVAVIAKIMGMPGVLRPVALGVGFGVAAWTIFVYWLFVPLPAGLLGLA